MRYRIDYQMTHDIDWFFIYQGRAYHAASNGGRLPDSISSTTNRELQVMVEELEAVFTVKFPVGIADTYGSEADLSSFCEFAKKGFISLDRVLAVDDYVSDAPCQYRIIAFPSEIQEFPNEQVLKILPELSSGDIQIK